MDSEDGQVFVKNLAYFVRTHERALANALQLQRSKDGQQQATAGSSSIKLSAALSKRYLPFSSSAVRPAKLTLTPHHLYFLLSKFEDLGVDIGPMNVRLENLQHNSTPSNYVSFLGNAPKSRGKQSDAESLRSVSSVRSVMSSMSSLWSNITMSNSAAKAEKQMTQYRDDIKYLYSCFTKIPALKLSPDHRARLVAGYEEFPFETAVPLFVFKNVSALEICDLDFRQFHGWDRISEQLRSLALRRAKVDDPFELLYKIVLDDRDGRRKRSFKTQLPTTPSTPGVAWQSSSPRARQIEMARTVSAPNSPYSDQRRGSRGSPGAMGLDRQVSAESALQFGSTPQQAQNSDLPSRPINSRHGSLRKHTRTRSSINRRSSGSSGSDTHDSTPRNSTTDLLAQVLPSSKWRFLRHLSLAENSMTFLTAASLAPISETIQSLDLSGNLFSDFPDALASLTHLRALNLSNCMIDSLQSLTRHPLPAITTLNLRSNRLANLAGIERLPSLERVDVRDNRLRDPMELARLATLPEVADIYVARNPFTRSHVDYRIVIFNAFRTTPGRVHDITIDTLGPVSTEKKHLIDRVPEVAAVPVVRPPPEDDVHDDAQATPGGAATADELRALEPKIHAPTNPRHGHRRATSDIGPIMPRQKKRPSRRRIVELSLQDSPVQPKVQDLDTTPRTPTDSDTPTTPGDTTPFHTAPTTQVQPMSPKVRPALDTSFESPTPAPKIRDPSDDELSPQDLGRSDVYRTKIEGLKSDLGPGWLAALNEDRASEQRDRRSFSPASRTSTIRQGSRSNNERAMSVGGRALG